MTKGTSIGIAKEGAEEPNKAIGRQWGQRWVGRSKTPGAIRDILRSAKNNCERREWDKDTGRRARYTGVVHPKTENVEKGMTFWSM